MDIQLSPTRALIERLHTSLRQSFESSCEHIRASHFYPDDLIPHFPAARQQLDTAIRESEALLASAGPQDALSRLYELGAGYSSERPTPVREILLEATEGPFLWLSAVLNPDPSDLLP